MDCSICCEKFNKSTHFKIECKTCQDDTIVSCRECCKKYLTDNPAVSKCMICKIEWDKEFLFNNFTKVFINKELKEIKETVLLEKEIAKLPETQEHAERIQMVRNIEKQKEILNKEEYQLKQRIIQIRLKVNDLTETALQIQTSKLSTNSIKTFTQKCPVDNCKGFLDSKFDCGLCLNKICKHCMEIKQEEHECDKDKKDTITLLKKDTKGCPKCGQLIFKIDGCDQMWCPPCHTAFSWKTGQVEDGHVHNPEYYRWMRETNNILPRNPGDEPYDPCGNNLIPDYSLLRFLRIYFKPLQQFNRNEDKHQTIHICNMHRIVRHIDMLATNHDVYKRHLDNKLRDLRAFYLLNEIGKETWKSKLQTYDKKQEKDSCFINVWNLLKLVLIEYIGKIVELKVSTTIIQTVNDIITESEKIRLHCNESFKRIGNMYNCVYPGITKQWIQIDNYKKYIIQKK